MRHVIILLALASVFLTSYADQYVPSYRPKHEPSYKPRQQPSYKPIHKPSYKKSRPCYMCEYRPPKTVTFKVPVKEEFTFKVSRTIEECWTKKVPVPPAYDVHQGYPAPQRYKVIKECRPKVVYDVKKGERTSYEVRTKTTPAGGFEACKGPLEPKSAKAAGVDTWKCDDNCYTRYDGPNVFRGCFKGEFGLDPNDFQPQELDGYTYHFCAGALCNAQ